MKHSYEQTDMDIAGSATVPFIELNAEALDMARRLVADPEHTFRNPSQMQAEHMAKSANIELGVEEIFLYCALREQMPATASGSEPHSLKLGVRPEQLSDQEILAAVLELSGDVVRLKKFTEFYSNIFTVA